MSGRTDAEVPSNELEDEVLSPVLGGLGGLASGGEVVLALKRELNCGRVGEKKDCHWDGDSGPRDAESGLSPLTRIGGGLSTVVELKRERIAGGSSSVFGEYPPSNVGLNIGSAGGDEVGGLSELLLVFLLKRDVFAVVGGKSKPGISGLLVLVLEGGRDGSPGGCPGTAKELTRACSGLHTVLELKRDLDGSGGDRALSPTAGLGGEWATGEANPKRKD